MKCDGASLCLSLLSGLCCNCASLLVPQHLLLSCFFSVEFASLSATDSDPDGDGKEIASFLLTCQQVTFVPLQKYDLSVLLFFL